ncbi:gliding motility-associated C-terminal domain-containing protein [bacterium SCSIO 12741]|nr:gliding motility-associated C-terminal domain-containing protein [bacterium SCSIO 12741]
MGRATNSCGDDQDQFTVTYENLPQFNLGPDTTLCNEEWVSIGAVVPNQPNYLWSDGSVTPKIRINAAGTYTLTVTNSCGSYRAQKTVSMRYTPQPDLGPDQFICEGEELRLKTGLTESTLVGATVKWQGRHERHEISAKNEGIWRVEVSNDCGTGRDSMELNVHLLPTANLPKDTTFCDAELIIDLTGEALEVEWDDGQISARRSIQESGNYVFHLTDENGCQATERIAVKRCPGEFYYPNSFSPNGDGANDFFRLYHSGLKSFHLTIYNRWNEVMFESYSIDEGWDGLRADNQTRCPLGQYIWKAEYKEEVKNTTRVVTGKVYLVR